MSRKHNRKGSSAPPPGFPSNLRKLRERYGMSPEALSECCGLSRNIIRKYERGERCPSVDSVVKIANFFDVSTDSLIGRQKN